MVRGFLMGIDTTDCIVQLRLVQVIETAPESGRNWRKALLHLLGDARLATTMADQLLARGIYVIGFSYPVVPKGQARIRVQLSAAHSIEQIDHAVAAFTEVGRDLGVLTG